MSWKNALAAGMASTVLITGAPALAGGETRVKIADISHHENGCSESSKGVVVMIPNPEKLDLSYKGVLAGIERVYTEANGTRRDGDYVLNADGKLSFVLSAKGGGTRISGFG